MFSKSTKMPKDNSVYVQERNNYGAEDKYQCNVLTCRYFEFQILRIVVWLEMPIVGSIDVLDTNQVDTPNTVRQNNILMILLSCNKVEIPASRKRLASLDRFVQHEVQDLFDQFLHN